MSKRNLLLGTATGKVGDLVFYRSGGEQRTRAKVTPNNPKTYDQQAQRSRMANVTLLFRTLGAIVRDTFPNRPANQSAFNAFCAGALPGAPYLLKSDADLDKLILQPCKIAKGSLQLPFRDVYIYETGLVVAYNDDPEENPSDLGMLARQLITRFPCVFEEGSKLIFVAVSPVDDEVADRMNRDVISITLDTSDARPLSDVGLESSYEPGEDDLPGTVKVKTIQGYELGGGGVIVMKPKSTGGYDVTNSELVLATGTMRGYENHLTEEAKVDAAISYGGVAGSCITGR